MVGFLQTKCYVVEKIVRLFFFLRDCSFVIDCYILFPLSCLEKKGKHQTQHTKNGSFKKIGILYLILVSFKKENRDPLLDFGEFQKRR